MSGTQQRIDLKKDVLEIAEGAIEAFGLTYDRTADQNLHDPLIRWCDFVLRYIAPAKRRIYKSDRFPVSISDDAKIGLQRIEDLFITGGDVNPYQSKTLTLFNDTSGKKVKKRTDGLWADWDIHHLHLPLHPADPKEKYSGRSEWMLFLKVYSNAVHFIDIKHHDNMIEPDLFSQQDLIGTFIRNWPEEAERFRIRGEDSSLIDEPITDAHVANLRNNGINTPFHVDGKIYFPPGMGLTTAVTAIKVSTLRNQINNITREIEKILLDDNQQFMQELQCLSIDKPEFQIALFDNGVLGIHEKKSDKTWHFPRLNSQYPSHPFCLFNNYLMPEWAGPKLVSHWKNIR